MATTEQLHREQGVDIDYRPFHPLAFVSIVMGVLSLLTFASFAMLIPAVVAIATGWLAIRGCEGGVRRSGHRLAAVGVALASLGATVGLAHYFGRIAVIKSIGRGHASEIVRLLEKDYLEEVFSLSAPPLARPEHGTDQVTWYRRTDKRSQQQAPPVVQLNIWLGLPPVAWFYEDEVAGTHTYVAAEDYKKAGDDEVTHFRFRYTPANPDIEPFLYRIELRRSLSPRLSGAHWTAIIWGVIPEDSGMEPVMTTLQGSQKPRTLFRRQDPEANPDTN